MSSFRRIPIIRALLFVGSLLPASLSLLTGAHAAEPSAYRFNHYLSSDKSVTSFYKTSSGLVLVGTRDGLYEYLGENTYGNNVIFPGRSIEYMTQDSKDWIWACSGETFIFDRRT